MKSDIRSVSQLKAGAAQLLRQVNNTRRPVIITQNGEARGVLQDPESYEATRRALVMLKLLAQGEADVRASRVQPQDKLFAGLRASLGAAGDRRGKGKKA